MDRDGSGTIDRLEYIQYLASPDPTVIPNQFQFISCLDWCRGV